MYLGRILKKIFYYSIMNILSKLKNAEHKLSKALIDNINIFRKTKKTNGRIRKKARKEISKLKKSIKNAIKYTKKGKRKGKKGKSKGKGKKDKRKGKKGKRGTKRKTKRRMSGGGSSDDPFVAFKLDNL